MKLSSEFNVMAGNLLLELFSNLIENSINHSNCNKIVITAELTDDAREVKVTIDDDGKGVAPEIYDLLFQREVKSKGSSGSGLGLYLCKKIIEKYDGKIELCDSQLGGASFAVYIKRKDENIEPE